MLVIIVQTYYCHNYCDCHLDSVVPVASFSSPNIYSYYCSITFIVSTKCPANIKSLAVSSNGLNKFGVITVAMLCKGIYRGFNVFIYFIIV